MTVLLAAEKHQTTRWLISTITVVALSLFFLLLFANGNYWAAADNETGGSPKVVQLATGDSSTCALTDAYGIKCWGNNTLGRLGDGSGIWQFTPVDVFGLSSGVEEISADGANACALTDSGGVKCWGWNTSGQVGDGTTTTRYAPVDVTGLTSGVQALSAGSSCALTDAGGVKCWGWNAFGQVGDGSRIDRLTPVDVSGLTSGIQAISSGVHTCALTDAGGVKCWGRNAFGQVGDGSTTDRLTPVDVTGLSSGVQAITVGSAHTCALTDSGAVKCWGHNGHGQFGDGSTNLTNPVPVDVAGLSSGVQAISAGSSHTCALTESGAVKCSGFNGSGQLGDGSTTDRSSPVDVAGLSSGLVAISAGGSHTCALTDSGGVRCWGRNFYGQLGDGSRTDRLTAVYVVGLAGQAEISVDASGETIYLGDTATVDVAFSDPGDPDTYTAMIDWGDGSGVVGLGVVSSPFSSTYVYAADGAYTVAVTVNGDDGGIGETTAHLLVIDGIAVAANPDRSSPLPLHGASLSGTAYIFMFIDPTGVARVKFLLDGEYMRWERLAPYDFAGGSVDLAGPFNVNGLTPGAHTITAIVQPSSGASYRSESEFTVEEFTDFNLLVSDHSDRSSAQELTSSPIGGIQHVFLDTSLDPSIISSVKFYVDDPTRSGEAHWRERLAPYDFAGGSVATAQGFDFNQLTVGTHTITTEVQFGDATGVFHTEFQVRAPVPAVQIQKSPDVREIVAGGTAEFSITVTNTGETELQDVTVSDLMAPDCETDLGTLGIGESVSYDCAVDGITEDFLNTATVTGISPAAVEVTDEDVAFVLIVSEIELQLIQFLGQSVEDVSDEDLTELVDALLLFYSPDVCVQRDGVIVIEQGDAVCLEYPSEAGNIGIAVGAGSFADASEGTDNIAIASGGGFAAAGGTNQQRAIALRGGTAFAFAERGDGGSSTSKAFNNSEAWSNTGAENTVTAINESYAEAVYSIQPNQLGGINSRATAVNDSVAAIGESSNNVAFAINSSCTIIESINGQKVIARDGEQINLGPIEEGNGC